MAKLSLAASPTFTATVLIPVPGKRAAPVEFTFKARTRDALQELIETLGSKDPTDQVLELVSGWDLEDSFSRDTVDQLLQSYIGAAKAISDKYFSELMGAKLGN